MNRVESRLLYYFDHRCKKTFFTFFILVTFLSGAGTSHHINGIIVQPTSLTCAPSRQAARVDKKDRRRTLEPTELMLPAYISSTRELPPPLKSANLSQPLIDAVARARHRNLLRIITRLHDHEQQNVSSWTGFNIHTLS